MTLQEAIDHCYDKANELKACECAKEHLQLARWLEELIGLRKENKRLNEEVDALKQDLGLFL